MNVSIPTGSCKDITLKISKSKLKIKKADLRNANAGADCIKGSYIYSY